MIIDTNLGDFSAAARDQDVVIVGGGTVSLLVAKSLADHGHSVAIIEAGERVASANSDGRGAQSVGKPHRGVLTGRAFGLGGTSTLWGGQLVEFAECDLVRPGHEWPIDFEELVNWYRLTYEALDLPSHLDDEKFRRAFGIPEHPDQSIEHFFTRWLPQPNFAALFRDVLVRSDRIKVFLNMTANDILFEGDRARALLARSSQGRDFTFPAKHLVCAAGTIGNAQLFLTAQRKRVPWQDNRQVGKYFQDHLGGKAAELEVRNHKTFRRYFENGVALGSKLQPKLRFGVEARRRATTGVCGFFVFRSALTSQIAQIKSLVKSLRSGLTFSKLSSLPRDSWRVGGSLAPFVIRYLKDKRITAFYDQGVDFVFQAEQWPMERSAISVVGNSATRSGLMPVAVDWQLDGREIANIREFVASTLSFLESNDLARVTARPDALDDDEGFLERIEDTYHQSGGLRMSRSPQTGVTDANCRVWGTQNVYVAGASVFPTSSYANCTLTALALGLRLANRLHQTELRAA